MNFTTVYYSKVLFLVWDGICLAILYSNQAVSDPFECDRSDKLKGGAQMEYDIEFCLMHERFLNNCACCILHERS